MTEKLCLSALVYNRAGVLLRVAGLFARRGFNIISLTVSETENPERSRMTIVSAVEPSSFDQVEQQLLKLEDVIKVIRLTESNLIASELLLIKVNAINSVRPEVLDVVSSYGARVRDIGHSTMTLELTGASQLVDEFIDKMESFGITELSRSGSTALGSGDLSINDNRNF